jgi:alcohol dehydrogenase
VSTRSARALVLEKPRTLVARELAVPEHGDDDAVLRVEACGLCGTDHEQYTGHLAGGFAFVPGHETVGVIEGIGDTAAQRWGIAAGDRVAVEVFQACRACDACRAGAYQRCERHGLADMYGYIPVDKPPGLWGGYAETQYLGPDTIVHRIPDVLDPVVATLFNPLGAGLRWAVTVPGTSEGDVVAVLGPGVRGLSAAAAAKDAGAAFVMVTGRGARDAERLAVAGDFGADLAVDVADTDPVRALRDVTGGLADVVVDVTAKAPEAFAQAIALVRAGGTIVVAGTRGSPVRELQADHIVFKELRIIGALGVDSAAYRAALALLATDRYPFADLPRRVARLDDAEDLIRSLAGEADTPPPIHGVIAPA